MTYYQKLNAGYTANGNRNAIYLEYDETGSTRAAYAYNHGVIPEELKTSIPLPDINVTPKEIREWKKLVKGSGTILDYL